MNLNDFLVSNLESSLPILKMHIGDLSDADLLTRPVPGANHANWQIGHMLTAEVHITAKCGAKPVELPAGFAERYTKETAKLDGQSNFATKADLLALYEKTRANTIAWAKTLTPAQLDAPSPVMPDFLRTVAHVVDLAAGHIWMHTGQIQVLRRKLGKPILF